MKKYPKKVIILLVLLTVSCLVFGVSLVSYLNSINPKGIVIHHSAVPFPQSGSPLDVKAIDEIHKRKGYCIFYWGKIYHVGYHYIILPNGTLQQGRPEKCQGAHTSGYNDYVGICLIGDFSSNNKTNKNGPQQPTNEQMQTLSKIIDILQSKCEISTKDIRMHNELNAETECPGENFPEGFFGIKTPE